MTAPHLWCQILGITPPRLGAVKGHREANTYALFLVALLERQQPMTLAEVAERFEAAGIARRARALTSLQRSRPARAPVYRDGDRYGLDPYDDLLRRYTWMLDLRTPPAPAPKPPPPPAALPGPEVPLTRAELDEAWEGAPLLSWSERRLVLAVLEADGGPLTADEAGPAVDARRPLDRPRIEGRQFGLSTSPVKVRADGRWEIADDADGALRSMRKAVRALVQERRGWAARHAPNPDVAAAYERERARQRAIHAGLSRAVLVTFPTERPVAAALIDVGAHQLDTFVGDAELATLRDRLARFDVVAALDVRAALRGLGVAPGAQRLAELTPPIKTRHLSATGHTFPVTAAVVITSSCGLPDPLSLPTRLAALVDANDHAGLRRRLASDARALFALYSYGRLRGLLRLRHGVIDEMLPAPWAHGDEVKLVHLMQQASAMGEPLEVVVGRAPSWDDPWGRAQAARVVAIDRWRFSLMSKEGRFIDEDEVQAARLTVAVH